eukprot:gene5529-7645_t
MRYLVIFRLLLYVGVIFKVFSPVQSESFHGGTYLALTGKNCVLIASDSRFSTQQSGTFCIGKYPRLIFRVGSRALVGCYGLESDIYLLMRLLREKFVDLSDEEVEPHSIARVIANTLYSKQLICSPVVLGIDNNNDPYICSMDGIGAQTVSKTFAVGGTSMSGLYAILESLYVPNLEAPQLVALAEKCMKLSLQRDVESGCDVRIFTLDRNSIYKKDCNFIDT